MAIRFFKFTQTVLLAVLAFYSLATHAGTISVAPTTASGGTTGVGVIADDTLYYTVSNIGSTDLLITGVTSSLADFVVSQPTSATLPVVVPAGTNYLLTVLFKPTAAGNRSANITISSNDTAKPTTVVTATGYGGTEASIRLTPITPFNLELGQGTGLRANVTFDNGATGVALLNWTSSKTTVATAAASETDISFGPVATGNVVSVGLGTATITVSGVRAPTVKASVAITVVPASNHEFMSTVISDRVVRVKNGVWSLCYDFPEADVDNRPAYDTNQIGVTTPRLNTIGGVYVTADNSLTVDASEQIFFIKACDPSPTPDPSLRTIPFNQPTSLASFRDLVVESTGRAVASNTFGSDIWQVPPETNSAFPIPRTNLPPDDVGALAIDSFDNIYMANLIKTTAMQTAAVYVRPFGTTSWFPVAAVFGTVYPSSAGIPGMAAIFEGNKGYAMKIVDFDKTIVERYIDLNGDGNMYQIVGTSIVADPGEIVEVAAIDAGVDITVDGNRNLIASIAEPIGHTIVKMTDNNNDGDFKDPGEYTVIYQSTLFTRIKDIAFAAPCGDKPPTAAISTLPLNGTVDIGATVYLLGSGSTDPCSDPLTYVWTDEDKVPPVTLCTGAGCAYTCASGNLPALHKIGLTVKDPAGNTNKAITTVKCGPPVLNGFWPADGVTNSAIYLFGKNYRVVGLANPTVCFNNGTLCQPIVQVLAPDLLFVSQPAGVTTGKITVTTAMGKATSPIDYPSVTPGLKINGLWPSEVFVGGIVFVFGKGFSLVPGANVVKVNGVTAPLVQTADSTMLFFLAPAGATTGPVTVTTGGVTATSPINLIILP